MIPGHWKAVVRRVTAAVEYDIEYVNGWRETVRVPPGGEFVMPFSGVIVGIRSVG